MPDWSPQRKESLIVSATEFLNMLPDGHLHKYLDAQQSARPDHRTEPDRTGCLAPDSCRIADRSPVPKSFYCAGASGLNRDKEQNHRK